MFGGAKGAVDNVDYEDDEADLAMTRQDAFALKVRAFWGILLLYVIDRVQISCFRLSRVLNRGCVITSRSMAL